MITGSAATKSNALSQALSDVATVIEETLHQTAADRRLPITDERRHQYVLGGSNRAASLPRSRPRSL